MTVIKSPLLETNSLSPVKKVSAGSTENARQHSSPWPMTWRVRARLAAAITNSLMVTYVYAAHLSGLDWNRFGNFRAIAEGDLQTVRDYLKTWDLDPVFNHLRLFTFSEAMLENLEVYMIVGTPVALSLFFLELQRTRWLDEVIGRALPGAGSSWMRMLLNAYMASFGITLSFILAIGPFHLELPRAHYICAFLAIGFGCFSLILYLLATKDLNPLLASGDVEAMAWAAQTHDIVRPVLKCVAALHILVFVSATWKAESLADDRAALAFGIVETSLVLAYQVFGGIFFMDDMLMGRALEAPAPAQRKLENNKKAKQPAAAAAVE
eukprot:CAMPEP_0206459424 /NCGR_PEP_ID=MMETSP0324_2-20121206/24164_1 /ASSEMBLY_ACC=CAM_ASM_000836 /TAXON_ID=2866 /ORGANISM="Crypthecodinium cohnii, Strain Seligo" /LENGTH=323 /DNA_ID=CAMNT_0053930965 /DNA_START=140 /DNA_END=1111 /DNA_ORIENTATION=+